MAIRRDDQQLFFHDTIAAAFGSTLTVSNWNPSADVNVDGKVDMKDIAIAAADFGQYSLSYT